MERKRTARPRGADGARVIQVIETNALRGLGVAEDPVRNVTQYWDLEGRFLAERDEWLDRRIAFRRGLTDLGEKDTAPAVEEQERQEPKFVPEDSEGRQEMLSQKCCC